MPPQPVFWGDFEQDSRFYSPGGYTELQQTIDYFQGSFGRDSVAARQELNAP